MRTAEGLDFKADIRKPNPISSARPILSQQLHSRHASPTFHKAPRPPIADPTDDRKSDKNKSHNMHSESYAQLIQEAGGMLAGESRISHQAENASGDGKLRFLSEREEKVVELRERLKNIHHFYRIRIEEERAKNIERNEIFIGIIEELQRNHSERLIQCRKSLEDLEEEKNELGYVDERMGNIKATIEQILLQSKKLKQSNENIEKELLRREVAIKEKETRYIEVKEEVNALRDKLQQFERLKLKENKRNKEILEMIDDPQR